MTMTYDHGAGRKKKNEQNAMEKQAIEKRKRNKVFGHISRAEVSNARIERNLKQANTQLRLRVWISDADRYAEGPCTNCKMVDR